MEEERRNEYGFCPKCGAVMQNGICQSCGYGKRLKAAAESRKESYENETRTPRPERRQGMSAGGKAVLTICIVLAVLFILFFVLLIFSIVRTTVSTVTDSSSLTQDYYDYYNGYGNENPDYDYYSQYVPDPDDDYYKELADATAEDLTYQVEWRQESRYPDNSDDTAYLSITYPVFTGEKQEELDQINRQVKDMADRYVDYYESDGEVVSVISYVTLMQEDRLSVVCRYEVTGKTKIYRVEALNFDRATGERIDNDQLIEVDDSLPARFRAQNEKQNGSIDFLDQLSDEDLIGYLSDDDSRIAFLTPVGTEIGFNYDEGWITVTLKENTL